MKKLVLILFSLPIISFAWVLPQGQLNKSDWDSNSTKGKVTLIFYVSPSKKNLNNEASEAIKKEKFDHKAFASVGVIDLKSSWIPNRLILSAIKKKQKKYPRTIYLKDKKRHLHKILNFKPKGNDVFVLNAEGEMIYSHLGKLNKEEIKKLVSLLKKETRKVLSP